MFCDNNAVKVVTGYISGWIGTGRTAAGSFPHVDYERFYRSQNFHLVRLPARATKRDTAIMPAAISKNFVLLLYMDYVHLVRLRTYSSWKMILLASNTTSQVS